MFDIQQWFIDPNHNWLLISVEQPNQQLKQYAVLMSYQVPFLVVELHVGLIAANSACNRDDDFQCSLTFLDQHNLLQPNENFNQAAQRLTQQYHPYIFNRK